ncbi:MAG: hypothetical protein HRU77_15270 [Gammaproteobacteria bacterium]|nr:MAG: hypothetical protein HRU77_15270 [Gammaproteobacteria bacterium]
MDKDGLDRRMLLGAGLMGFAGSVLAENGNTPEQQSLAEVESLKKSDQGNTEILKKAQQITGELKERLSNQETSFAKVFSQDPIPKITFKRANTEKSSWDRIVKSLDTTFKLTKDGSTSATLTDQIRRIEYGFIFKSDQADTDFSWQHVEPLLDQAADLLDRALRERSNWDDLAQKWFATMLEIHEYAELDKIHVEEEEAGIYEVPLQESTADYRSNYVTHLFNSLSSNVIEGIIDVNFGSKELTEVLNANRKGAWLAGLVPYTWKDQHFNGYSVHTYGKVTATVAQHAADAAETQSDHEFSTQGSFASSQLFSFNASMYSAAERMNGANAKKEWDQRNSVFLRRRTLVARKIQDIKARAATDPDGILNAGKRLEQIKARFQLDFRDALARLLVIQRGLSDIYGYDIPLPQQSEDLDYYDRCLLWTRQTMQWLIRFSRQEQCFVLPISIRGLIGDDAWLDGRSRGVWNVDVTKNFFLNMAHVRVRGLSAFVNINRRFDTLWRISVKPPMQATIQHMSGKIVTVDQSKVPPSQLARVGRRDAIREPDVVGVASLHNVSPIGIWTIRALGGMPLESDVQPLEDLSLDLLLSFRAV